MNSLLRHTLSQIIKEGERKKSFPTWYNKKFSNKICVFENKDAHISFFNLSGKLSSLDLNILKGCISVYNNMLNINNENGRKKRNPISWNTVTGIDKLVNVPFQQISHFAFIWGNQENILNLPQLYAKYLLKYLIKCLIQKIKTEIIWQCFFFLYKIFSME